MINRWFLLAILAALTIGAVAAFVVFAPSPADEVGTEEILIPRGPAGTIVGPPEEFRWNPVRGARSYRVAVFDAKGETLWEGDASEERLAFPEELREEALTGASFFYRITAKGRFGAEIVSSERVLFRCRPAAEG